jgi:hypothetical protein
MVDYQSLIDQQTKTNQSLSERLDEIAKQNDMWSQQGASYIDSQPKADLYDPNKSVIAALNLKTQSLAFSKAQQDKYDTGVKMLMDLLGKQETAKSNAEIERSNKVNEMIALLGKGYKTDAIGNLIPPDPNDPNNLSDSDATAKVKSIFGNNINLGATAADRGARAKMILKDYAQGIMPPIADLLSPDETKQRNLATDLMRTASDVLAGVTDQQGGTINATGVGILGGRGINPAVLLGKGAKLRSDITGLTAAKMKEFSGVAVSDREVKRLGNMLPRVTDTEAQIAGKAKTFVNAVNIGLKMQEKAKQENLTLDQAYEKYAAPLYTAAGEEIPAWLAGGGENTLFNAGDLMNKYWPE